LEYTNDERPDNSLALIERNAGAMAKMAAIEKK
jgi:hypothetical protein